MEITHFHFPDRWEPGIAETVFYSLMDQLVPGAALPWVEAIFVPGHPCYEEYCTMQSAYDRLLQQLGKTEEDPDAEDMINALLEHGKIIALEMFRYGREYQKMQNAEI